MKNIAKSIALLWMAFSAHLADAHVSWDSINDVTCPTPYDCRDQPIDLTAGATISVAYDVVIKHGAPVQIDISGLEDNASHTVLKTGLSENPGVNTTSITLPDLTCEQCILTVRGSGYSGEAAIRLLYDTVETDDTPPSDVTSTLSIAEDNQVHLMWDVPKTDFSNVLILQSQQQLDGQAVNGESYTLGDTIGNGRVAYIGHGDKWTATSLMRSTPYYFKILSVDAALNYSQGTKVNAMTTDIGNNPPWATLEVTQKGDLVGNTVVGGDGPVSLQVQVKDADTDDHHSFDWTRTDNRLMNLSDETDGFIFDPVDLEAGDYTLHLSVSDNGAPLLTHDVELSLTVVPEQTPMGHPIESTGKSGGTMNLHFIFLILCLLTKFRLKQPGVRLRKK